MLKNKFVVFLLAVAAFVFTLSLVNLGYGYDVPIPTGYIVDQTGKLSSSQVEKLSSKLMRYKNHTGNQIGVLITPSLGGESVEDVSYQVFNTWKIGEKGKDNGVLLLISVGDRKTRIETGKGVGGVLPDVTAKHILDENLKPFLRRDEYYQGINNTTDALMEALNAEKLHPTTKSHASAGCNVSEAWTSTGSVTVLAVFSIFLLIALFRYFKRSHTQRKKADQPVSQTYFDPVEEMPPTLPEPSFKSYFPPQPETFTPTWQVSKSFDKKTPTVIEVVSSPSAKIFDTKLPEVKSSVTNQKKDLDKQVKKSQDYEPPSSRKNYSLFSDPSPSIFDSSSGSSDGGCCGGGESGGGGASGDF